MPARQRVDVAAVRAAHPITDVVAASGVQLTARGHGYMGCCPFHEDNTASMSVDGIPDRFHCFGCGASGDVVDYVQRLEGLSFIEAVRRLETSSIPTTQSTSGNSIRRPVPRAERAWSTSPARVHEINDLAWTYFTSEPALTRAETYLRRDRGIDVRVLRQEIGGAPVAGYACREWRGLIAHLTDRGVTESEMIDADLAQRTREGHLIDAYLGRLMAPVRGAEQRIDGFIGRDVPGRAQAPKYRNPTRTPTFDKQTAVYRPTHQQLRADATTVVVEGALDALAVAAAAARIGQSARFAPCTTSGVSVSAEQASRVLAIHPRPTVIALDGDAAGTEGTLRWLEQICLQRGRPALVTSLPPGCDPAEWLAEHGPAGLRAFDRATTFSAIQEPQPQLPGRQLAQLAARQRGPVQALVAAVAPLLPQLPAAAAERLLGAAVTELVGGGGSAGRFRGAFDAALGSSDGRGWLDRRTMPADQLPREAPERSPFPVGPEPA